LHKLPGLHVVDQHHVGIQLLAEHDDAQLPDPEAEVLLSRGQIGPSPCRPNLYPLSCFDMRSSGPVCATSVDFLEDFPSDRNGLIELTQKVEPADWPA
jgi:hypothetical protein